MTIAQRIVVEAKKLINTPFCHFGRSSIGLDCSGLIWLTHTRSGIEMPRTDDRYSPYWWRDSHQGERILNAFQNTAGFEICDQPVIGGLVMFRLYGKHVPINHCGILVDNENFIHAKCGIGYKVNKVTMDLLSAGYRKRIACYMKHKDIDYGDDQWTNNW
jgi:cell wall-associated NlpC family hydrolase